MQPERERLVARGLAAWERAQRTPISDAERAAREPELARRTATFPFHGLSGAAIGVALVAGAAGSRQRSDLAIAPRLLAISGGAAAISIAVVIALDATIH